MALIKTLGLLLVMLNVLHAQLASERKSRWIPYKVEIKFKRSCYEESSKNSSDDSYDGSVDGVFPVGCTVQAKCSYYPDDCEAKRNDSQLEITLTKSDDSSSVIVTSRNTCDVEVLIPNVRFEFNGQLNCQDQNNEGASRSRTLKIGYRPVKPENLMVVYTPNKFIRLTFDKMKTGVDLNDNDTKWDVTYLWRNSCSCPDGDDCTCTQETDPRIITCEINLRNAIQEDAFYPGDCFGSTHNTIDFTISVKNQFGENVTTAQYYLPDQINPGRVSQPHLYETGTTWLQFHTHLPKHMRGDCKRMNRTLKLQYMVFKVSETEEQRLTPETNAFYQEYGFYRNLQDDEVAASRMNLTNYTYTDTVPWPDCKLKILTNVTGLAPFSRYTIKIRLLAQYEGSFTESGRDQFMTAAHVPQEGPAFNISPYTCFMGQNSCVSCAIYFEEIPRPLRQSNITGYRLTGILNKTGMTASECKAAPYFEAHAQADENFVLVEGLMAGSLYGLSIQAHTHDQEWSPFSTYLLETKDLGDSVTVELEVKSELNLYKLHWDNSRWEQEKNISYFVHYCYSNKILGSYNCRTNRVIEHAASSQSSDTMKIPMYYGSTSEKKSLRVLFFMSVERNGEASGLYPEKWRYAMDRAPGQVSLRYVRKSDWDPSTLEVMFERTKNDEDNPLDGRPRKFAIGWQKITCQHDCDCSHLTPWNDGSGALEVEAYRKGPFLLKDLEHSTMYCVRVRAEKDGQSSPWVYDYATTGEDGSSSNIVIIAVLGGLIVPVVLTGVCILYCYCKKSYKTKTELLGNAKWPGPRSEDRRPLVSPPRHTVGPRHPGLRGISFPQDSGIEEGPADGLYGPGNEIEASGLEAAMEATGLTDTSVNPRYEASVSTVSESSAPASEGSEEEGVGRYGRITTACSETACSETACSGNEEEQERMEERENIKWRYPVKEEVATDDEQITDATDDEQITDATDDEQTFVQEHNQENVTCLLRGLSNPNALGKQPDVLFEPQLSCPTPESEKLYDSDETRGAGEQVKSMSKCVEVSFPNVDKTLTVSEQTLGKESGFYSEDCKSDSNLHRYSTALSDSSSVDILQNGDLSKQQGNTPTTDAMTGDSRIKNVTFVPQVSTDITHSLAEKPEVNILSRKTVSQAECDTLSSAVHRGNNNKLVPQNILLILEKTPARDKSNAEVPVLDPGNNEFDFPSMMNTRTSGDIPACVPLLLKKPQNEDADVLQSLPSAGQEALTAEKFMISDHADGISSEEEVPVLEEGGSHFPLGVQKGLCSSSAEADETLTIPNPEIQDSSSKTKKRAELEPCTPIRGGNLCMPDPVVNTVPQDQEHYDIISRLNLMTTGSQSSSGEMIRLETRTPPRRKINGMPGNDSSWTDQCKSEPTRRKQISYCRVTSAKESS